MEWGPSFKQKKRKGGIPMRKRKGSGTRSQIPSEVTSEVSNTLAQTSDYSCIFNGDTTGTGTPGTSARPENHHGIDAVPST